jgi:hypothetical protein
MVALASLAMVWQRVIEFMFCIMLEQFGFVFFWHQSFLFVSVNEIHLPPTRFLLALRQQS